MAAQPTPRGPPLLPLLPPAPTHLDAVRDGQPALPARCEGGHGHLAGGRRARQPRQLFPARSRHAPRPAGTRSAASALLLLAEGGLVLQPIRHHAALALSGAGRGILRPFGSWRAGRAVLGGSRLPTTTQHRLLLHAALPWLHIILGAARQHLLHTWAQQRERQSVRALGEEGVREGGFPSSRAGFEHETAAAPLGTERRGAEPGVGAEGCLLRSERCEMQSSTARVSIQPRGLQESGAESHAAAQPISGSRGRDLQAFLRHTAVLQQAAG